ncbi:hypothetical protein FoTM2_004827 [Fusarium oxysporum f. sp. vasinfectum]|uniref:Uncharacterized protein n=1 Tax=Fusarium oxysporum f. sp. vasinfectum 25433 TaxID=1089449 RepID=X0KS31_FUSOX|nr:hypothetical protein FOTG_15293 [Fusarium oxysporum f. sp. vasinfectum 25433]KAK2933585.1 hypothetical protein FoTM2_004827 [Fusarium oxysporum f. sp. vasinfectum]
MSSKYRPLLPNTTPASSSTEDASGSQPQSSLSGLIKTPRAGNRTACGTDKEEKSILALEWRNSELMTELEQLRELYSMIHSRSIEEAQEIFNRIRTNSDPT